MLPGGYSRPVRLGSALICSMYEACVICLCSSCEKVELQEVSYFHILGFSRFLPTAALTLQLKILSILFLFFFCPR